MTRTERDALVRTSAAEALNLASRCAPPEMQKRLTDEAAALADLLAEVEALRVVAEAVRLDRVLLASRWVPGTESGAARRIRMNKTHAAIDTALAAYRARWPETVKP